MKKLTALLLTLSFALIIPVFSSAQPETQSAPVIARAATHFTCGEMQTGSFGSFPETHSYTVYLQGNKGVAFMAYGAAISYMKVYAPNGSLVGTILPVTYTATLYGVLTTPGQNGNYTIQVYGCCGTYYVNCLTGQGKTSNTNTVYNRSNAAEYAQDYAESYNPNYPNYNKPNGNGDCTNFVSQCVYDGGMPMKVGSTDAYWYYNSSGRSPSWAGADYFMRHWTKVRSSSYYGRAYEVRIYTPDYIVNNKSAFGSFLSIGDIVQVLDGSDSEAAHSIIISQKTNNTSIKYCAHTNDTLNGDIFTFTANQPKTRWVVAIRIRS